MVRVKRQEAEEESRQAAPSKARGATTRTRAGTKVRTRCTGNRTNAEEVQVQLKAALPQIVRANVEKAKGGSLVHTKWLWGVAEQHSPAGEVEQRGKRSLAALLLEQLGEATEKTLDRG